MATIKSYSDLEQSRKLAEILPIESADMYYWCGTQIRIGGHKAMDKDLDVPCWSLAALHGTLTENKICHYDDRYYCQYMSEGDEFPIYSTAEYDNPVDACYEMILKLHVLNLL